MSFSGAFAQSAKVTVVLVPGASGATPSDFLIRKEKTFASHGLQTKVATSAAAAVAAANALRESGGKAVLVGMSAATPAAAQAIAQGALVAGAVFVAGTLVPGMAQRSVAATLGDPWEVALKSCRSSSPRPVPNDTAKRRIWFCKMAGGKAKVVWIDGGNAGGNPMRADVGSWLHGSRPSRRRGYRGVCEDTMIVVEAQKEIASSRRDYRRGHFALASLTPDHALSALWSYRRNCPQDATAVL